MRIVNLIVIVFIFTASGTCAQRQEKNGGTIFLNQVGFYPKAPKLAVVLADQQAAFRLVDDKNEKTVFSGTLQPAVKSIFSEKKYSVADFSSFVRPGRFRLEVEGVGKSNAFEIGPSVHLPVAKASIRNYYYQRMSVPLDKKFAGKWARPMGHPDDKVLVHASAATNARPEGTVISAPKGWYDAGDYNKYIVNSGVTMGTMFSAWEDYSSFYRKLDLGIPESSNSIPDLLDELLWNLRWMLTMQDPADGGVYHKLTNPGFDGMVMPHAATKPRFVVQKGTAAALDFAAVMAQAGRIFRGFEKDLPGLADSCITASQRAWAWAEKNPSVVYDQGALNSSFDPDITTGAYGDRSFGDEFIWAAAELFVTTRDEKYLQRIPGIAEVVLSVPSWNDVAMLGYYTLLRFENAVPSDRQSFMAGLKNRMLSFADDLAQGAMDRSFRTVMGKTAKDYIWGSSSVAANQAIVMIHAWRISGNEAYLHLAQSNLDYLLGRNATGYSFVTGFGTKQVMHPHHRPSEADGIVEPVPGMLSGGPNPGMQDKCAYPTSIPEEAFVDDVCSYASNEIAINWNAPLVYLTGAMEALQGTNTLHRN